MRRMSKSSLFIMELTLAILMFSISAAVCLQMMASAKQRADNSAALSRAVLEAQTTAEEFKYGKADTGLTRYYDGQWNSCSEADAVFVLQLTADPADAKTGVITVSRSGGEELYRLSAAAMPSGGAAE